MGKIAILTPVFAIFSENGNFSYGFLLFRQPDWPNGNFGTLFLLNFQKMAISAFLFCYFDSQTETAAGHGVAADKLVVVVSEIERLGGDGKPAGAKIPVPPQ